MKIGRLYILIGKHKKGVTTAPAKTLRIISIPFLPLMLWITPKEK